MIAVDASQRRRLLAAARLLESDKEGERIAALQALLRLLPPGVTLADLLESALSPVVEPWQPEPHPYCTDPNFFRADLLRSWQRKAMDVLARAELLNDIEERFAHNMMRQRREPTPKQMDWLDALAGRVKVAA